MWEIALSASRLCALSNEAGARIASKFYKASLVSSKVAGTSVNGHLSVGCKYSCDLTKLQRVSFRLGARYPTE
jgi:hypothetical protein